MHAWYYIIDTRKTNQELQFEFISGENQHLQHKLATMLQMSNAKDWQIAQLEYKLCSQPMLLSSQSNYLENTSNIYMHIMQVSLHIVFTEPQCYVSTIDSAVQADYLAIAPG